MARQNLVSQLRLFPWFWEFRNPKTHSLSLNDLMMRMETTNQALNYCLTCISIFNPSTTLGEGINSQNWDKRSGERPSWSFFAAKFLPVWPQTSLVLLPTSSVLLLHVLYILPAQAVLPAIDDEHFAQPFLPVGCCKRKR